jgi:hypothetical protein
VLLGNSIAYTVNWNSDARFSDYASKPVRLKVELRDADLFALQFVER